MDELARTDWRREGETIVRDLKFDDFAPAMAYVNRVADLADEANHHQRLPDGAQDRRARRVATIGPVA